jgi:ribonuclease P protein subunit RPR2
MADRLPHSDGLEALEAVLLVKRVQALEGTLERERAAWRRERDLFRREREAMLDVIVGLVEQRDASTGGHCRRVSSIAVRICRELDHVPGEQAVWGFLLHDVGKILVRDAVLQKRGPLTPEEWIQMRRHPEEGAHLLRPVQALGGAVPIVLHHHERWDGAGYPLGLRRTEIPLEARAFAIADAFDAITEDRPYRRAHSVAYATEAIVEARGTQFDPECVDAFIRCAGTFTG